MFSETFFGYPVQNCYPLPTWIPTSLFSVVSDAITSMMAVMKLMILHLQVQGLLTDFVFKAFYYVS